MTGATALNFKIKYKLSDAYICNNGYCLKNIFILVKNLKQ